MRYHEHEALPSKADQDKRISWRSSFYLEVQSFKRKEAQGIATDLFKGIKRVRK